MTSMSIENFRHSEAARGLTPPKYSKELSRLSGSRRVQRRTSSAWPFYKFLPWLLLPPTRFPHEVESIHLLCHEETRA